MSTQVPQPVLVNNFSLFASRSDSIVIDNSCLSTVDNDVSECSVSRNTVLSKTGDMSATESSDMPTLDSGSFGDKSVTLSDLVLSMDNDGSIEYERMSLEGITAVGLVGVSESKIPVELEHRKVWQPFSEPWDCDFYLYQRAFPRTWGAGIQWWLWYMRNMGCGGCQEGKNMCRFY